MADEEWSVEELLDLADIPSPDRDEARRRLESALQNVVIAFPKQKTALGLALANAINSDVVPAYSHKPFDDLSKIARKLLEQLRALRSHPYQHLTFWANDAFGPIEPALYHRSLDGTLPIETEVGLERTEIIQALQSIIAAAADTRKLAKRPANRPRRRHKDKVVETAALFWLQHSPNEISGTVTGKFHEFAEAFYEAATGRKENVDRPVDRTARRAKVA